MRHKVAQEQKILNYTISEYPGNRHFLHWNSGIEVLELYPHHSNRN